MVRIEMKKIAEGQVVLGIEVKEETPDEVLTCAARGFVGVVRHLFGTMATNPQFAEEISRGIKEEVTVDDQPDEDRVKQSKRDYEEQKRAFLKRAVMQEMGRRAGKGSLRILSEKKLEEKAAAAMAQLKEHTWEKRISTP